MVKPQSTPTLWILIFIVLLSTVAFISCPEPSLNPPAASPVISPDGGIVSSTQKIEITTTTDNASIYYTVDGDEPTESSTPYTNPFTLNSSDTTVTVKAIAAHPDFSLSPVTTSTPFTFMPRLVAPTISSESEEDPSSHVVTLSALEDASIYYTLNGESPTTSSMLYTTPLDITVCTNLQAIAVKEGYDNSPSASEIYTVRGPAGGFVFYDKGENIGGWRYLEAAPSDVDSNGYDHIFGLHRVEGENIEVGTQPGIGAGKVNTDALVGAMGEEAYTHNGKEFISKDIYAAKLSDVHMVGSYNDWFLPSKDELNLMYQNLKKNSLGDFADDAYWSSSEVNEDNAWLQFFNTGFQQGNFKKENTYKVRPIRAYLPIE